MSTPNSFEAIESSIWFPDGTLVQSSDIAEVRELAKEAVEQHTKARVPFRLDADGGLDCE